MPSHNKVLVLLASIVAVGGIALGLALFASERERKIQRAMALTGGNPDHAMRSIVRYGCSACHAIPGAPMPGGLAASSLANVTDRRYLGGVVNNTPDNLVRWIVNPKQFSPSSGMPITGIGEAEARDIAAYFYTHL